MIQIDLQQVLRDKNPAAAKWVPRWAVRWLGRIVHVDEINRYLAAYGDLPTMEFIRACLREMNISCQTEGMENLDPQGRYIFASNHPFGGADGLMLADQVERHFGDVRVVVNDILMNLAPLAPIFVPINKHGRQNPEYARLYTEAFASDIPIITFPAGLCSRRIKGAVTDLPWKSNFIRRAIADRRDVVPVHFEGVLSNRFYRLSNIRKALGIKANIEMLFLVDELFRQSGNQFKIKIGPPVPYQTFTPNHRPDHWCQLIRQQAYSL